MKKNRTLIVWLVLIAALTVACACPMITGVQKKLEAAETLSSGVSTVGAIVTQLPAEEMMKTASAALTKVPAESLLTQMPGGILETAQAGGLPIPEGLPGIPGATEQSFDEGDEAKMPEDIPLLADPEYLGGGKHLIGYQTKKTVDEAVDFYKTEMPKQGWVESPDSLGTDQGLIYTKANRTSTITCSLLDIGTYVEINIVEK